MDPHQANLQPNLLLGSRLRFNPSPTFLGVTFDRTLSFSKHVSSLKAKFFPRLKALRCISASSWGPSKESLSILYKAFLRSLLTYASPGWFPFLSVTDITKSERIHRADSRAITGSLSSSPNPTSSLRGFSTPPPLQVTLSHFTLSSHERALRLPTSFPISSLARLGVKPRLCRSSWRAFASTHPLIPSSTSPREALTFLLRTCFPSLWSPPFPLHALALISLSFSRRCSSRPPWLCPHSRSGTLDWRLCSFSSWQGRLWRTCQLLSLWQWGHSFLFSMFKFFRWSLRHSASFLVVSAAPTSLPLLFSSPTIWLSFCPRHLSSPLSFLLPQTLLQICQKLSSFSCSIRLQWIPGHSFLPGNNAAGELARREALLAPSAIPCSLSPLTSRIHSRLISDWRRTVSSKFFDTQVPSISTEELVLPRHARCVLSRLRCNKHSLLLSSYLSRIGRIENPSCSACGHPSQDTSHLILHCPATDSCAAHSLATLCLSTTSGPDLGQLPGFWDSMVFRHAPIRRKGSGKQQQHALNKTTLTTFLLVGRSQQ